MTTVACLLQRGGNPNGSIAPRWAAVLDGALAPAPGTPLRRDCVRWLAYAAATLHPAVVEALLVAAKGDAPGLERARRAVWESARVVESALSGRRRHLVGDTLTAADVVVGRVLAWAESLGVLEPGVRLAAWLADVARAAARLPH